MHKSNSKLEKEFKTRKRVCLLCEYKCNFGGGKIEWQGGGRIQWQGGGRIEWQGGGRIQCQGGGRIEWQGGGRIEWQGYSFNSITRYMYAHHMPHAERMKW